MAKGKSLLNKTSTKQKKSTSKRKTTDKSIPYDHEIGDILIYIGIGFSDYVDKECEVVDRSRQYIRQNYKIKFDDGVIVEVINDVLKTKEEYELYIKEKTEEVNTISEIDAELIRQGIESLKNPHCCHNQICFYEMRCHECDKEKRCIYINKGKYKKLDIW